MYRTAQDDLARVTISHASQHQHLHLATLSAEKRAEAGTRARQSRRTMPRLHLLPRRWAAHS
jgi:hypothetical protein